MCKDGFGYRSICWSKKVYCKQIFRQLHIKENDSVKSSVMTTEKVWLGCGLEFKCGARVVP